MTGKADSDGRVSKKSAKESDGCVLSKKSTLQDGDSQHEEEEEGGQKADDVGDNEESDPCLDDSLPNRACSGDTFSLVSSAESLQCKL